MQVNYRHPEIELLERDDVVALQRTRLVALGERLSNSPAWVERFAAVGMSPRDLASHDGLAAMPTLEKADLRHLYPYPFLTVPLGEVRRFMATSGTTGLPVMFGMTERDMSELLPYQMTRLLTAAGMVPEDLVYQGYGYGLWIGGPAFDIGIRAMGATNFPIGPGRGEVAAQWLKDHGYTAISSSPLWLMTLVNLAKERGIDPRKEWKLRLGLFGGQSVAAAFRDELEAELPPGFQAQNVYGTTEAGGPLIGTCCPHSHDRDEMHLINEDTLVTEIVDPVTLRPVAPGEVGEVVITTLMKEASPVVRWRTHDLVRLSERPYDCPCGRKGFPLVGRIIGRSDDMLKVRGVIVFPTQIEDIIAATEGTVKEAWHIYVDSVGKELEELTVEIERTRGCNLAPDEIARRVQHSIHSRIGIRVEVVCRDEGALPRYEAKAVRVHLRSREPR